MQTKCSLYLAVVLMIIHLHNGWWIFFWSLVMITACSLVFYNGKWFLLQKSIIVRDNRHEMVSEEAWILLRALSVAILQLIHSRNNPCMVLPNLQTIVGHMAGGKKKSFWVSFDTMLYLFTIFSLLLPSQLERYSIEGIITIGKMLAQLWEKIKTIAIFKLFV